MIAWRAIVPLNLGGDCKTRLADALRPEAREALVMEMAAHVVARLEEIEEIDEIAILSPVETGLGTLWVADQGRGLNEELAAVLGTIPTLILHADLPLLKDRDVEAMLVAGERSAAAIAPDRHGSGTNAIALLHPPGFVPAFGPHSLGKHRSTLGNSAIIERLGLALDIDTPEDLKIAATHGFHRRSDMARARD